MGYGGGSDDSISRGSNKDILDNILGTSGNPSAPVANGGVEAASPSFLRKTRIFGSGESVAFSEKVEEWRGGGSLRR